jgi:hypothetical protein
MHVVTLLAATSLPGSSPPAALAAVQCSSLDVLPDVLARARTAGLRVDGGARGAKAIFDAEPLLADASLLSASFDACSVANEATREQAKKETLRALAAVREEFDYQIGKGVVDPRFPDPDDANDLQLAFKRLSRALDKALEAVRQ